MMAPNTDLPIDITQVQIIGLEVFTYGSLLFQFLWISNL